MPVDIAGLKIAVPPLTPPANVANGARDQEAQHLRRIRELEEELRVVRVDNEKQVRTAIHQGAALCVLTLHSREL